MEEHELKYLVDKLESVRGNGTWHITVYRRPGDSISSLQRKIESEVAEAEQIKSDDTRDRVKDSLKKIQKDLSARQEMPENGIAIFSSPEDIYVFDKLPVEVEENVYHCGKEFLTDPVRDMFRSGGEYGLLVIERGGGAVGVLRGAGVITISEKESGVMGKTQAGGQSQQRFERERKRQKHEFFEEMAHTANASFEDVDGVVVGGTSHTVDEFMSGDYLDHELQDNVLQTFSVEYGNEQGLEELASKASGTLSKAETAEEREKIGSFFEKLRDGLAEYGCEQVERAIEYGAVGTLILTTELDRESIQRLKERAENKGADVYIIDPDFEKAKQFQKLSNGCGALLRYEI